MEKLTKLMGEDRVEIKSAPPATDNLQAKSLEDWKASLTNIRLACTTPNFPRPNDHPQNSVKLAASPPKITTV
jgi:hypothetical protein